MWRFQNKLAVVLFVSALAQSPAQGALAQSSASKTNAVNESTNSVPKDTTPYVRPALPEDYKVVEEGLPETISPFPPVFMVDVVVNNTDPTLINTDTRNDGEPSIAV